MNLKLLISFTLIHLLLCSTSFAIEQSDEVETLGLTVCNSEPIYEVDYYLGCLYSVEGKTKFFLPNELTELGCSSLCDHINSWGEDIAGDIAGERVRRLTEFNYHDY